MIDSNIDLARKFQLRNIFLNIKLVYCRILFTFFVVVFKYFFKNQFTN